MEVAVTVNVVFVSVVGTDRTPLGVITADVSFVPVTDHVTAAGL